MLTLQEMGTLSQKELTKHLEMKAARKPDNNSGRILARRYNLVAYKTNGEEKTIKNLSAQQANKLRAELRKEGFARVDKLEVQTTIETVAGTDIMSDIAASHFRNGTTGPVSLVDQSPAKYEGRIANPPVYSDARAEQSRVENRIRREAKDARFTRNTETVTEHIKIYDNETHTLLFIGTEAETIIHLETNPLNLRTQTIYLPSKIAKVIEQSKKREAIANMEAVDKAYAKMFPKG